MTFEATKQQDDNIQQDVLQMDVQADEDDCMASMGYMFEQYPRLQGCAMAISPRVSALVASESIKMLFMFDGLRRLQLRFDFDDITITQHMVCAVAELLQLTSLEVLHGELPAELDLSYWTSLRSLQELKLLPGEQNGLRSQQVEQLAGLSSSLTSLFIRPQPESVTADALWALAGMTGLQELSLCPLPDACGAQELQLLLDMPHLIRLQLGTNNAAQVMLLSDVKVPRKAPQLSLVVRDACEPGPAADVLTVISWTLQQHLTALSIGPLAAPCPNDVLVTLATLTHLQSLQLQLVAPPGQHVTGTVELLTLSPCRQLTCLELLTSSRLYMPFSLKTVSLATLAWPHLAALRLSLAGKRELMPEALDMCDNFTALRELQLFRPLEESPLEEVEARVSNAGQAAAASSSSWAGWAAASLSSLGLFSMGTSAQGSVGSCSSGMASTAQPSRAGLAAVSPLEQDLHQRSRVQQQQWREHAAAHQQHMQAQHSLQDAAGAHSQHAAVSTLQQEQLLPAAVGSFQAHKIYRADSLFGPVNGSKLGQQGSLDGQGSGGWSPTWLLKSFMPFGSPSSSGALGTADSLLGQQGQQQQQEGSWGVLDACRGAMPRAASLESSRAQYASTQRRPAASRLQHISSLTGDSSGGPTEQLRRTATISGHGAAELVVQQQQRQQQQQCAGVWPVSAPGQDLAMYRVAGQLLPLNLNYLPNSLTKLCLQSYHLVAIGMPQPPGSSCSLPGDPSSTAQQSTQQQPQQQELPMQEDTGLLQHAEQQTLQDESQGTLTVHEAAACGTDDSCRALMCPGSPTRVTMTEAGACTSSSAVLQLIASNVGSAGGCSADASGGILSTMTTSKQLPLPHLLHLELDSCRIDDDTMIALLSSSPALRTLEIAGLEGLTDAGMVAVSTLQHLTCLCVEAEDTPGLSLKSLTAVRCLHRLKKLHWCSRDSLHGPLDTDLLTAQLSGLTGLRQLVLLVAPDSEAFSMSGWRVVLQRRLPLCRLVLRRELLMLDTWQDVPQEGARS